MDLRFQLPSILVTTLLVAGCAELSLSLNPNPPPTEVLQAKQITEEIKEIANTNDVTALRIARQELSAKEADIINQASELIKQKQYGSALNLLRTAKRHLPDSTRIQNLFVKVDAEVNALERSTKHKLLIIEAENVLQQLALSQELESLADTDRTIASHYLYLQKEAKKLSDKLIQCGKSVHSIEQPHQGLRCLKLAKQLNPEQDSDALKPQVELLEQALALKEAKMLEEKEHNHALLNKRAKTKASKAPAPLRVLRPSSVKRINRKESAQFILIDDIKHNVKTGELKTAVQKWRELPQEIRDKEEAQTVKAQLDEKITPRINSLLQKGQTLYKRERFAEARVTWLNILDLDPGHEQAIAHLERTSRVLDKIEELKESARRQN